ncbi:hypothetical protein ATY41_04780 [Leifsonia xyli subsp. xyli]|uniref:Transcriptional regulator, LuxR family n=2 Tax=Leifsonia xyli subsp. xyli TaxID=59736 RepID=Q6ACL7_LEIXX|nr:LuxR C-terminal-related transcriptional regulator [Leifsonia xyli]AAT89876.1 transcriptional regulator, LuxR family [Leifsonia xyli subsp. xyli str. CTCB07]ODA89594.1 hypothetical protein ATY41_04780 [Leifsonia xyli subsp. xyli]
MVDVAGETPEPGAEPLVLRRTLVRQLDEGERDSATIAIIASTGTGKTELLRRWCGNASNKRKYFDVASDSHWLDRLAWTLGQENAVTVVVDAVERVEGNAEREQLLELVTNATSAVVLSGRDLPITIAAPREERPHLSIGPGELALRFEEAYKLLRAHGVTLDTSELLTLVDRADGRAATPTLAAETAARAESPGAAMATIRHSPGSLATLLVRRLLDSLNGERARLLLALSTVPSFDAELAAALAGCPYAIAALEEIGFGPGLLNRPDSGADPDPHGRYSFEPSFRDGLMAEFLNRDATRFAELHSVATEWHIANGDIGLALEQALHSGSADLIEDLLRRFGLGLVFSGSVLPVRNALAALKDRGVLSPTTGLLGALVCSPQLTESVRVDHFLALAEDEVAPRSPERDVAAAALHALRSLDGPGADAALSTLEAAVARTTSQPFGEGGPVAVLDARLFAEVVTARVYMATGHPDIALHRAVLAADGAEESHRPWLAMLALDTAANIATSLANWALVGVLEHRIAGLNQTAVEPDSLVDAGIRLRAAYRSCEPYRVSQIDDIIAAQWRALDSVGVLAPRALRLLFRLDTAPDPRAVFEQMEQLFATSLRRRPETLALSAFRFLDLAFLYRGRSAARNHVDTLTAAVGSDHLCAFLGCAMLREGTPAQEAGAAALETALTDGTRAHEGTNLVLGWLLLAQWSHNAGDDAAAQARLTQAVTLAERMRARRPFLARPSFVRLVSDRLGSFGAADGFAASIVEAAGAAGVRSEADGGPESRLTARERDLLRELPLHQTVPQIAAKHSVSVNTVKTHLRSIYTKVGASGRAEAVQRARELGLL